MSEALCYFAFPTTFGWVGLLGSARGLVRTTLPAASQDAALARLGDIGTAARSRDLFGDLIERLSDYFRGRPVDFPGRLDLSGATLFQRRVWAATGRIPYGETRSYGGVALEIGRPGAARAVGQALGANPIPIVVPCHRVTAAGGGLGGFGGGLELKRRLLALEASRAP